MITDEQKLKELGEKGNGWYMKFKYNTVLEAFNGILYNLNQEKEDRCEKVFVYNTISECINAAWTWKVVNQQGAGRKIRD